MPHISLVGPCPDPLQRVQGHANIDTLHRFIGVVDFGPMPVPLVMQSLLSGGRGKRLPGRESFASCDTRAVSEKVDLVGLTTKDEQLDQ